MRGWSKITELSPYCPSYIALGCRFVDRLHERFWVWLIRLPASRLSHACGGIPGKRTVRRRQLSPRSISVAITNRRVKGRDQLPPVESKRDLCVARLVGQVQNIMERSRNPQGFDAIA